MESREDLARLSNSQLIEKIKERKAAGEVMTYAGKTKPDLIATLRGTYVRKTPAKTRPQMSAADVAKMKSDLTGLTNKQLIEVIKDLKAAGKEITYSGKKKDELVNTIMLARMGIKEPVKIRKALRERPGPEEMAKIKETLLAKRAERQRAMRELAESESESESDDD